MSRHTRETVAWHLVVGWLACTRVALRDRRFAFGITSTSRASSCLAYLDGERVCYPVGVHMALYNCSTKEVRGRGVKVVDMHAQGSMAKGCSAHGQGKQLMPWAGPPRAVSSARRCALW